MFSFLLLKLFDDITSGQSDIARLYSYFFTSGRDWAGFALVSGIDQIFVIAGIGNFVAAF